MSNNNILEDQYGCYYNSPGKTQGGGGDVEKCH